MIATADDEVYTAALSNPVIHADNVLLDLSLGRFYAEFKFQFLEVIQCVALHHPVGLILLRTTLLLVPVIAMWMLFAKVSGQSAAGALTALAWIGTYALFPGYQPLLSNPTLLVGLAAVLFACYTAWLSLPVGAPPAWRMLSLLLYLVSLLCHEVFVVFIGVLLWVRFLGGNESYQPLSKLQFATPYLFLTVTYTGLYFSLKHQAAALNVSYEGTQIAPGVQSIGALLRYTVAALPGFELFFQRNAAPGEWPIRSFGQLVDNVMLRGSALDAAAALVIGAASTGAIRALGKRPSLSSAVISAGVVVIALLPNLLITLTPKYQFWAQLRRFPYYYAGLSTPFVWFLATWVVWTLHEKMAAQRPRGAATFALGCGVGIALLTFALAANNRAVAALLHGQPFH